LHKKSRNLTHISLQAGKFLKDKVIEI